MFDIKQQYGIDHEGKEIALKQFQIVFDGILVGYLPHGENQQIQALLNFPHDELDAKALEYLGGRVFELLKIKTKVLEPEQYSREFADEARRLLSEDEGSDDE